MRITGKNINITPSMEETIEKKLKFLDKFLSKTDTVAVTISSRKTKIKICIIVNYLGKVIKIEREVHEFYEGLDIVADKLKNTIARQHSIRVKQVKEREKFKDEIDESMKDSLITIHKEIETDEITEEEAINRIEELGHDFFLFKNSDKHNHTCVLYRRYNGTYGLIEKL